MDTFNQLMKLFGIFMLCFIAFLVVGAAFASDPLLGLVAGVMITAVVVLLLVKQSEHEDHPG